MKKIIQIIAVVIILVLGFFAYQYLIPQLRPPQAFLKVESAPSAEVFLNGESLGKSPLQKKDLKVGNYDLEIKAAVPTFPENDGGNEGSKNLEFSRKIDLEPSAVTSVKYEFAPDEIFSSGEILSLRGGAGLSVTTNPENAEVFLDGKSLGNSPLSQVIDPGVHLLKVEKEGYVSREVEINIEEKFRLSAWASLALNPYPQTKKLSEKGKFTIFDLSSSNATLTGDFRSWAQAIWHFQKSGKKVPKKFDVLIDEEGKQYTLDNAYGKKKEVTVGYLSSSAGKLSSKAKETWDKFTKGSSKTKTSAEVRILDTPNGFLNVRSGPGTNHSVIQKVNPGESYELVDEEADWYKILLKSAKEGWIFAQYAKKL
jgi:hypothetical protein